jgi:hypothetical protein
MSRVLKPSVPVPSAKPEPLTTGSEMPWVKAMSWRMERRVEKGWPTTSFR